MRIVFAALGLLIAYLVLVVILNRNMSLTGGPVALGNMGKLPTAAELTVSTWNLGYAGLGAESDFVVDGGKHLFPPSRAIVRKNIKQIEATAATLDTDVAFFQEISFTSPLSLWQPLARSIETAMGTEVFWFRPDISTRFLPWPLRLKHGTAIATDLKLEAAELRPIVGEPDPIFGVVRRQYAMQIVRLAGEDGIDWVLINLHLSAFDGGGSVRRQQVRAVFDYALAQHQSGARVILGGDWNMELTEPGFAHSTDPAFMFWIHPFPQELVPEGWRIAIDPVRPTVRTVHKAYVPGENYTTIIDGFIVSPNVEIVDVHTTDTGFSMSDHMPVSARFRAAPDSR